MTITQNHIAEFTALAVSIICWKYLKKGSFHLLPFFLSFILCVELVGNYFQNIKHANIILYNCTIPLEYLFYLFLFFKHGGKLLKLFSKISALILVLIAVYFILTVPMQKFHNYVLAAGQVFVIISCCIYLYECFSTTDEDSLLTIPFFWLSAGLLLFNLGEFTFTLLYPIIKRNNWDSLDNLFMSVNNNLLLLLYLSYIITIVLFWRNKKRYAR